MFEAHRALIQNQGRSSASMLRLHEFMKIHPVLDVSLASGELGLSPPTVRNAIRMFQKAGLVTEITGKVRNQICLCEPLMAILREGTDEPPG